MTTGTVPLTKQPAWKALEAHYTRTRDVHLRTLFAEDPRRGARFAAEAAGLYLDYSKHRVSDETLRLLLALAEESGLRARIEAMFHGDKINVTEQRAVLHVALRAPRRQSIVVDGEDVVPKVHAVVDRMADFSRRIRDGTWKGHTGRRMRNVVNIGIGGSDLGPVMADEALRHYSDRDLTVRFISNVDGTDFVEATRDLDPAETLFIVSSKTFTTVEKMTNARTAREWSLRALRDERAVARHFVAVSTNGAEVAKYLRSKLGGHVSYERVLSGDGIHHIYAFLRDSGHAPEPAWLREKLEAGDPNATITQIGLAGDHPLCVAALELFCSILGAEAGNLALRCVATGGVFVGGGIAPKIIPALESGGFVREFTDKGRFSEWMAKIPVRVAMNPRAPLLGAAHLLLDDAGSR